MISEKCKYLFRFFYDKFLIEIWDLGFLILNIGLKNKFHIFTFLNNCNLINILNIKSLSQNSFQENKKLFARIKKSKPKNIDDVVHAIHDEVFENINCLECANCCKTISPIITDKDIERISKHLKLRPAEFTHKYLHKDEDDDYVFNETPCPFLLPDNYCVIYESRPKACAEYPHTNRKKFYQLLDLTLKNTSVCPAVYEIVEKIKNRL